uniref:Uncharacterized protein n=1 Tax=Chromera velia CCMP2878 TaxID=1169474 RepID=A0A0G4HHS8_9ALVE|eukprot:Cvel_1061.t1-p1 / transcript=Cvel_1061.t1 / gene=Cvel_1061 / organism=Chromera_velia_CCMP2878 / gene_product=3-methylitaconate isomerase, putative / transcript_product=3-methylitaconate isomerase, putative / location=Cvel_scaffold34:121990-131797(+) / protein_length=1087 / sequence_SO=supercontig / SO=protein_coding / is_pseudo=false
METPMQSPELVLAVQAAAQRLTDEILGSCAFLSGFCAADRTVVEKVFQPSHFPNLWNADGLFVGKRKDIYDILNSLTRCHLDADAPTKITTEGRILKLGRFSHGAMEGKYFQTTAETRLVDATDFPSTPPEPWNTQDYVKVKDYCFTPAAGALAGGVGGSLGGSAGSAVVNACFRACQGGLRPVEKVASTVGALVSPVLGATAGAKAGVGVAGFQCVGMAPALGFHSCTVLTGLAAGCLVGAAATGVAVTVGAGAAAGVDALGECRRVEAVALELEALPKGVWGEVVQELRGLDAVCVELSQLSAVAMEISRGLGKGGGWGVEGVSVQSVRTTLLSLNAVRVLTASAGIELKKKEDSLREACGRLEGLFRHVETELEKRKKREGDNVKKSSRRLFRLQSLAGRYPMSLFVTIPLCAFLEAAEGCAEMVERGAKAKSQAATRQTEVRLQQLAEEAAKGLQRAKAALMWLSILDSACATLLRLALQQPVSVHMATAGQEGKTQTAFPLAASLFASPEPPVFPPPKPASLRSSRRVRLGLSLCPSVLPHSTSALLTERPTRSLTPWEEKEEDYQTKRGGQICLPHFPTASQQQAFGFFPRTVRLCGGFSWTSKVMVVWKLKEDSEESSECRREFRGLTPQVAYKFGQVDVASGQIDWSGNCGNLSAALGLFAVEAELLHDSDVRAATQWEGEEGGSSENQQKEMAGHSQAGREEEGEREKSTGRRRRRKGTFRLTAWQATQRKVVEVVQAVEEQIEEGGGGRRVRAESRGSFSIDGVAGTGACVSVEFLEPPPPLPSSSPSSSPTDTEAFPPLSLFPTGFIVESVPVALRNSLRVKSLDVTCIDAGNPTVFLDARQAGLTGTESRDRPGAYGCSESNLVGVLEEVRLECSVRMGVASSLEEAKAKPAIPKVAWIAPPTAYTASGGQSIPAEEQTVTARILSMGKIHHAFTGTGAVALVAALQVPQSIPWKVAREGAQGGKGQKEGEPGGVSFGHASGLMELDVTLEEVGKGKEEVKEGASQSSSAKDPVCFSSDAQSPGHPPTSEHGDRGRPASGVGLNVKAPPLFLRKVTMSRTARVLMRGVACGFFDV